MGGDYRGGSTLINSGLFGREKHWSERSISQPRRSKPKDTNKAAPAVSAKRIEGLPSRPPLKALPFTESVAFAILREEKLPEVPAELRGRVDVDAFEYVRHYPELSAKLDTVLSSYPNYLEEAIVKWARKLDKMRKTRAISESFPQPPGKVAGHVARYGGNLGILARSPLAKFTIEKYSHGNIPCATVIEAWNTMKATST